MTFAFIKHITIHLKAVMILRLKHLPFSYLTFCSIIIQSQIIGKLK